ncbi:MAG: amino acid permease, partial [Clostridia bacterium]|nr:amino acid permease [Clostridia bacterium]
IITTAIYVFIILLSVTAYPARYSNWFQYINDIRNLKGIEALPAFYAAGHYLGNTGLVLLFSSLFALVATSLIANTWALSRLMYAVGQDSIIPERYAKLNKKGIPARAIMSIAVISLLIPFLGRSAIGWIVDVTTIIATLLYGFISMATIKCAKINKDKREMIAGIIVLAVMIIFGAALLLPGLNSSSLEPETYLLFILWCVFGMIFFHRVIRKDNARRFGKAIIVWIVFVTLIIFLGIVWMDRISDNAAHQAMASLEKYHNGTASSEILAMSEKDYLALLNKQIERTSLLSIYAVIGLFGVSVGGFISNYFFMKKYETKLENDVAAKTEHIINMQNDLVVGMAAMVESRDNSTGGHIKRTSDVVRILVAEMEKDKNLDISEEFYKNVIKAAPMHDLGKIAVDDEILRKPGRFTPEEYEIMKTHAKEGAKIVSDILKNIDDENFKRIAENMAHYHHERFDGMGYPEKLKGNEIPLEARIMAIADVYDALVSKRVYKEKMTFDEADKIILSGMGTQFDGQLEAYYIKARTKLEEYYSSLSA